MDTDKLSLRRAVSGETRLPDPVDDAILTLAVRMRDPLSYKEIAASLGIARDRVRELCQPYREFLRTPGEEEPALAFTRRPSRKAVRPRAMWENAMFGNSGRESFQKQQIVNGVDRLSDPVDDAILTLGVRLPNPLTYEEIASLIHISRDDASKICEPYKEFIRKTGAYGIRGLTNTG